MTTCVSELPIGEPPVIAFDDPDLIGQAKAGRLYGVSPSSVSRHMTKGREVNGRRIKLPSIPKCRARYTTEAAVRWWFRALQVAEQYPAAEVVTTSRNDRANDAELEAIADAEGL